MRVYTYSEARKKLAKILSEARREDEVRIDQIDSWTTWNSAGALRGQQLL